MKTSTRPETSPTPRAEPSKVLGLVGAVRENAEVVVSRFEALKDVAIIHRCQRILELCADLEEAILEDQLSRSIAEQSAKERT